MKTQKEPLWHRPWCAALHCRTFNLNFRKVLRGLSQGYIFLILQVHAWFPLLFEFFSSSFFSLSLSLSLLILICFNMGVTFSGKCWLWPSPTFLIIALNYVNFFNFEGSRVCLVNETIIKYLGWRIPIVVSGLWKGMATSFLDWI